MAVPWRWGETPGGHATAEARCARCFAVRSLVYRDGEFLCRDETGCRRRQEIEADPYDLDMER